MPKNFMDGEAGVPRMKMPDLDGAWNTKTDEVPLPVFSDSDVDAASLVVDPENVPYLREAASPPEEGMQEEGIPLNMQVLDDESRVREALRIHIEGRTRPRMEVSKVPVGWPYEQGEGLRYAGDASGATPNDPSVIPAESWQAAAVSHMQRQPGSFFNVKEGKMNVAAQYGLGAWPSVTMPGGVVISQETAAQLVLSQIASLEAELRAESPGSLEAVQAKVAAQRKIMEDSYAKVTGSPVSEIVAAAAWQVAAGYYKKQLEAAIKKVREVKAKDAKKKKKVKKPGILPALPGAVKQTIFSKYGAVVLIGGAVALGVLFFLRGRK